MAKINLDIAPGISQTLTWCSQRKLLLQIHGWKRHISVKRAVSHRCFLQLIYQKSITPVEYDGAQKVWREFRIENMQQYHDYFLNLDILLLADIFEHFRQNVHFGLRTRPRTLSYFSPLHIQCISQIYGAGIGPVYRQRKVPFYRELY